MTDWVELDPNDLVPGEPILAAQALAFFENVKAAAEGSLDAPVVAAGWHPYDMATAGDGATGLYYDDAVDGPAAFADTPTFEDGFEYLIILEDVQTPLDLRFDPWMETAAAFLGGIAFFSGGGTISGFLTVHLPRITNKVHLAFGVTANTASTGIALDADTSIRMISTADKIEYVRIATASGNFSAGKMYLYRRREYGSG
jgi:hypothetical protein